MSCVVLNVVVDDDYLKKMDEVTDRLRAAGMNVEKSSAILGTVTGSADASAEGQWSAVQGVKSVIKDRKVFPT